MASIENKFGPKKKKKKKKKEEKSVSYHLAVRRFRTTALKLHHPSCLKLSALGVCKYTHKHTR